MTSPSEHEREADVAVIGSGASAIACAHLLARQGRSVVLVAGNDAHALPRGGTALDEPAGEALIGGPVWCESEAAFDVWEEIVPGAFVEAGEAGVYSGGRWARGAGRSADLLKILGPGRAALSLPSFLRARLNGTRDCDNLEQYAVRGFGGGIHARLCRAVAEKRQGIACAAIAAEWARDSRMGGLLRETGADDRVRAPRQGMAELRRAGFDAIRRNGGRVLVGATLGQAARQGEGGWRLLLNEAGVRSPASQVLRVRELVSTVALRDLVSRLHPVLTNAWNAAVLDCRARIAVALPLHADAKLSPAPVTLAGEELAASRAWGFRNPDAGEYAVLEYSCFERDALWTQDDPALIARARQDLSTIGIAHGGGEPAGAVVRQRRAAPLYDAGRAANLAAVRAEIARRFPDLHLAGGPATHCERTPDLELRDAVRCAQRIGARLARPAPKRAVRVQSIAAEQVAVKSMQGRRAA